MNIDRVRADFPVLGKEFPNGPLVYFDNACSTLKPRPVIDATAEYYRDYPVCGERSLHRLGREVTRRVDLARDRTARFLGAGEAKEVVFLKNATEGLNLVAAATPWREGDVVVTTDKEHSSNWLPWIHLAQTRGVRHLKIPSEADGTFSLDRMRQTLEEAGDRLRLVSVVHASNIDGVVNPVAAVAKAAHARGARVMVDAAQSAPHHPLDVRALGVDFLVASAHKMLGPAGLGFLYGRREAFAELGPFQLGGGTVRRSTREAYEWQHLPNRYEPGLQNYAGLWALPAALDYVDEAGREAIEAHERALNVYATRRLAEIPGLVAYGPDASRRGGILPFNLPPLDSHDVAAYVDEKRNIAIRSGAMCVYSYLEARGLPGWARASFYLYNTKDEVDAFAETLEGLSRAL